MSEPEKKDKPKKKKSVKEKEVTDGEEAIKAESKSIATPERKGSEKEPKSRKSSTAEGAEKQASRKSSTAEGAERKVSKSRKSSAAVESNRPQETTEAAPQEEDEDEEPFDPSTLLPPPRIEPDPNKTPFEAFAEADKIDVNAPVKYFEAPPETTKSDVHLLRDLDTRRLAELMEAFNMFDFDQDGVISASDLRRTFGSLDKPDVAEEEIQQMLAEGLNPLDFDAFIVLMGYKTLELDAEDILTDALSQWDYGTEGLISEERMRHDLMAFGDKFSEEEAVAALEDAPVVVLKNKERMIDYIKFSNDLCGLRKRMKEYQKNH